MSKINVVIPMAGLGSRFSNNGYSLPKPFLPLGGRTMLGAVVDNLYDPRFFFTFIINKNQLSPEQVSENIAAITGNFSLVEIDYLPAGPAASSALALPHIDPQLPLIITNCDQIIDDFSADTFLRFCNINEVDGVLGVFHSRSPKNSYVKLSDDNKVIDVKEKKVISNVATNGFHWWKKALYFDESYSQMKANKDTVNDEYYVAPSYNYLVQRGMNVMPYWFNLHYPIGTPNDYEAYRRLKNL